MKPLSKDQIDEIKKNVQDNAATLLAELTACNCISGEEIAGDTFLGEEFIQNFMSKKHFKDYMNSAIPQNFVMNFLTIEKTAKEYVDKLQKSLEAMSKDPLRFANELLILGYALKKAEPIITDKLAAMRANR